MAHVAIQGTVAPHDMLPGTEGDSDNQKVPPSRSSTFIKYKKKFRAFRNDIILSDSGFDAQISEITKIQRMSFGSKA